MKNFRESGFLPIPEFWNEDEAGAIQKGGFCVSYKVLECNALIVR